MWYATPPVHPELVLVLQLALASALRKYNTSSLVLQVQLNTY